MKPNVLEARGRFLYYNGKEVGEATRGEFRPNIRGERLGLFWAQVDVRGAMYYVGDTLHRSGKLTLTEWRRSRMAIKKGRK